MSVGTDYMELKRRCEQAERERDDLKLRFEVALDERVRLHADLQRAEADNAAWAEFVTALLDINAPSNIHDYCRQMLSKDHPGATLLAEVEALRKVRDEVVAVVGQGRLGEDETTEAIMSLVREANALKEPKR
jgi:hypothetical protein